MGLDKAAGTIYKNGKVIVNHNPTEAIRNKFALVPEDRKKEGILLFREYALIPRLKCWISF